MNTVSVSGSQINIPFGVDEALRLSSLGWHVFPLNPSNGLPYSSSDVARLQEIPVPEKGMGGFHLATVNPEHIKSMWAHWPNAQIGIATGQRSGVYVLDVDRKNGKDGFAAMEAAGLVPPETFWVDTKSGGRHYFYALPPETFAKSDGELGVGIDRKGDGGYVRWYGEAFGWSGSVPMVLPPDWMMAAHAGPGGAGLRPLGDPALSAPSFEAAVDALNAIDPNDLNRAEWIAIIAAYRQATSTVDPSGGMLAHGHYRLWCARYDHDKPGEDDKEWRSFDRGTHAGWRALLKAAGPDMLAKHLGLNAMEVLPPAPSALPVDVTTGTPSTLRVVQRLADWRVPVAFDEFSQRIVATGPIPQAPDQKWPRAVDDVDVLALECMFNATGEKPANATVWAGLRYFAARRSFNSVVDHLTGLQWDGIPRLDCWLTTYLHAESTPWTAIVGPKTLIAMVARAMQPGCKVDNMLVLESAQGTGKSTAFEIIAGAEHFTDDLPNMHDKEGKQALLGQWVVEVAELASMKRSEVDEVKKFITRKTEKFRLPYERSVSEHPRTCIFVGTTNNTNYLKDQTGNRRFWPVRVGRTDVAALRKDRDQLLAEAVVRYNAGEMWWLTAEQEVTARDEQDARTDEHPWTDIIRTHIDLRKGVPFRTADVIGWVGHSISSSNDPRITKPITEILTKMGYDQTRPRGAGADRPRMWTKRGPSLVHL